MNKLTLAESALNRLMNFADELDAPPVAADPAAAGDAIDAAVAQPVGELPASPELGELVALKGLGL